MFFNAMVRSKLRAGILPVLMLALSLLYSPVGYAAESHELKLSDLANNLGKTVKSFVTIINIGAYAAGSLFALMGILKFRAHKDNPTQIPLSTPLALVAISAGLLFLPTVFSTTGQAIFGDSASSTKSFLDNIT